MQALPMNEFVRPMCWLIGKWQSISADGKYPTIKPFKYCELLEFQSVGQPMLNYSSKTWHPEKKNAMHLESGFLRIKPNTNQVSLLVAHNFGLTTLEDGEVTENCLKLKTTSINRISFAKEPPVVGLERTFSLKDGRLESVVYMETTNTPLCEHLRVVYEKVQQD